MTLASALNANDGIHYFSSDGCEEFTDMEESEPKPWYRHEQPVAYNEGLDPTLELDYETAAPNERVEYSDLFLR
jgi:hypothetical protein